MAENFPDYKFNQVLAAIEFESISANEKVDLLIQIAVGSQQRTKSPRQLYNAFTLLHNALALCPNHETLLQARTHAGKGRALQDIPEIVTDSLFKAHAEFETALPVLCQAVTAEEVAEVEMNLGLVLQSLAGFYAGLITEAIAAYQCSLKVFTHEVYATEYAILHNNLAIIFLSISVSDERERMPEALATQSFQEALKVINLIDQSADVVLGQHDLSICDENADSEPNTTSVCWPHDIALWQGHLCVPNVDNFRVMIWLGISKSNGMDCVYVLVVAGDWLPVADTASS